MDAKTPYQKPRTNGVVIRFKPYYLFSVLLLFGVWLLFIVLTSETQRRFLVPHPVEVALRLTNMLFSGRLLYHVGVTLLEMGLGLVVGAIFAVVLGYAVAHNKLIAYIFEPVIVVSQAIPIVALAPLLTVWFGPGLVSKVVVCSLIVFFPILVNVLSGLQNINPQHHALFRLLEATPQQILFNLEIPATLPAFLSGFKVGGTLAGMGAVVGEFVASTKGLGYLVKQGQNLYDLPMMFAAIFVLMTITIIIYLSMSLLEKNLLRWVPQI